MKKIISLALATVMVFTMSAVAFAAGSVTNAVVESTTTTTGVTGTVAASAGTTNAAAEAAAPAAITSYTSYTSCTAHVLELALSAGGSISDATVAVSVAGIAKGDTITVLHYYDDAWHKVDGAYVNDAGQVVIPSLNNLSPFMVIKDTTTSTSSAPKTGEGNVVAVTMGVMLVAGVAACGLLRKKEEN